MIKKLQLVLALSGGALWVLLLAIQNWSPVPAAVAAPQQTAPASLAMSTITCVGDYTTEVFFTGLSSPDGLAMDADGVLHVSEESAGTVSRIESGMKTVVLSGLNQPEGIAFDGANNLYAVEDRENGRLLRRSPDGTVITITEGLLAPEGVQVAADGTVYVTESGLQTLNNNDPADFIDLDSIDPNDISVTLAGVDLSAVQILTDTLLSRLLAIAPEAPFTVTRVITHRPEFTPTFDHTNSPNFTNPTGNVNVEVDYLSFAGITIGSDDFVYVSLDLSNIKFISTTAVNQAIPYNNPFLLSTEVTIEDFTFETDSTRSILKINPSTGVSMTFASHLTTTEESRFQTSGAFPMYIIEEDTSGLANERTGRLSVITETNGPIETFCDGFNTIEDVLVAPDGTIYVTEDGTGSIIKISSPTCVAPDPSTVSGLDITYNNSISLTWPAGNQSEIDVMIWQTSSDPYFAQPGLSCQFSDDCTLFTAGTTYTPTIKEGDKEFYLMSSINSCGATSASTDRMGQFGFRLEPGS